MSSVRFAWPELPRRASVRLEDAASATVRLPDLSRARIAAKPSRSARIALVAAAMSGKSPWRYFRLRASRTASRSKGRSIGADAALGEASSRSTSSTGAGAQDRTASAVAILDHALAARTYILATVAWIFGRISPHPSRSTSRSAAASAAAAGGEAITQPFRTSAFVSEPHGLTPGAAFGAAPPDRSAETDRVSGGENRGATFAEDVQPSRSTPSASAAGAQTRGGTASDGAKSRSVNDDACGAGEKHYWQVSGSRLIINQCGYSVQDGTLYIQ